MSGREVCSCSSARSTPSEEASRSGRLVRRLLAFNGHTPDGNGGWKQLPYVKHHSHHFYPIPWVVSFKFSSMIPLWRQKRSHEGGGQEARRKRRGGAVEVLQEPVQSRRLVDRPAEGTCPEAIFAAQPFIRGSRISPDLRYNLPRARFSTARLSEERKKTSCSPEHSLRHERTKDIGHAGAGEHHHTS